ncbi:hypothetical protein FisN_13Lh277 [Fistulifera solaris]|uniref:Uncharacterized protein n=1 Tax=Fistulifera solaris TaxID=1519565 RepID=A0A1Z5KM77_FISSO|nr:hypothetical protein FisN_13Lh277 [Fistulifera solaris]|eukprot:GAX27172.1 hypothetical protein FisN_13Lh277 [Fistulifera solaris]
MTYKRKKNQKKQLSVQKDDPIPFPHDGCIHRALLDGGTTTAAVQQAVDLFRKDEMPLIHVLKTASSIKEQLHALHAFKSWMLQQNEVSTDPALYRLLLEWMLSSGTPLPLRKALQSVLPILLPTEHDAVYQSILASIPSSTPCWKDPVLSIAEALSWMSVDPIVQMDTLNVLFYYAQQYSTQLSETTLLDQSYMNLIQDSLALVTVVKTILENLSLQDNNRAQPVATKWIPFLYQLLSCRALMIDRLPIVSVAYARAIVLQHDGSTVDLLSRPDLNSLALLPKVVLLQGLIAAVLWEELEPQLVMLIDFLETAALQSSDLQVRTMALKTLRTVVSRCSSHEFTLPYDLMQIVLESWENPPCRKLAQAVAALFQSLIKVHPPEELPALVDRIMKQPPHRKGKYIALEIVLPLVDTPVSPTLLSELLVGISNQGNNRGAIANLWQTLLSRQIDWVPSLANALVAIQPFSSRQQVAAFCLPRIQSVPGGLTELLKELTSYSVSTDDIVRDANRLTRSDRVLWAKLEIVRLCIKPDRAFQVQVASSISLAFVKSALVHVSPQMRLAALHSLHQILGCYALPSDSMETEMQMIKYMLPFVVKTSGKEYVSSLLEYIVSFIDRLMISEQVSGLFPLTKSFVVDFLLGDMVHFLGYPGTVQDKETFFLSMLESLILFSARDMSMPGFDKRLVAKRGTVWVRTRSSTEHDFCSVIRKALVGTEVFAALVSILHSRWDGSRAQAYTVLTGVLGLVQTCTELELPFALREEAAREAIFDRALVLASSPRQREADSGARMLSIFCQSIPNNAQKYRFLADTITLLDSRLNKMKSELDSIAAHKQGEEFGIMLPLSHGIIQALHLIIENDRSFACTWDTDTELLLERLTHILCKGIRISLAVVADLKDGRTLEGLEDEFSRAVSLNSDQAGLKVNPGALGANGIFSSITRVSREEGQRRLVSQTIVMGSWLLTREACGAISAVFNATGYRAPASLLDSCATLLINTLTSLKHVGAAYAAHHAVEALAQVCFRNEHDHDISQLPKLWTHRLLNETKLDRIRDSTLRRSTGYALGFLAIMRTEIASGPHVHTLCKHVLSSILQLSLPSRDKMVAFTKTIGLSESAEMFSYLDVKQWQDQTNYEKRTRIHALNVLRLIILDSPLAKEIHPVIGDAIVTSMLGYTDLDWTVRNSSTMIFSAIMLRSIDADKNAKSEAGGRNATSLTELARAYPLLLNFLLAILKASVNGVLKSDESISLPPVLPILLLLARIQPVSQCGTDAVSLVEPFFPYVLRALEHPEIAIRKAAARALSNISSFELESPTSVTELFVGFRAVISDCVGALESKVGFMWNKLHGVLEACCTLMKKSEREMTIAKQIITPSPLFDTCWIFDDMPVMPPACLSVALDVLSGLLPSSTSNLDRCDELTGWLATSTCTYCAGVGELGMKIGDVTARQLAARIWDSKSWDDVSGWLPKLKDALTCPNIDIRVSVVKAFKKEIYAGLERTVAHCEHARLLIHSVALVMACSLANESQDPKGCHNPTLRRLSRCLLECLDSAYQLGILKELLPAIRPDAMIFFAVAFNEGFEGDSKTQVFGNAIELYSFFAILEPSVPLPFDLQRLVTLGSDPDGYWRVRHSAATAIGKYDLDEDSRPSIDLSTWMGLIQDYDEDVRFAAAKLVSDIEIPEIALSRLIQESPFLKNNNVRTLFVLQLSESLSQDILAILLNANAEDSDRKIFEEEDHNSYMERFLPLHIAVATCDHITLSLTDQCKPTADTLLQRCHQVFLKLRKSDPSLFFSASRQPNIFLPLHALLMGCAFVIKCTEDVDFPPRFHDHAEELLGNESAHPFIRKALSFLAQTNVNQPLSKACFLYQNVNHVGMECGT